MPEHEKLNYVEYESCDLVATKEFFHKAFGWEFTDYGPGYCDFQGEGLSGGFRKGEGSSKTSTGGALLIFYSKDLESTLEKVQKAGGSIVQEIFSFPGGRRFHFEEPGGNELAVWSDS